MKKEGNSNSGFFMEYKVCSKINNRNNYSKYIVFCELFVYYKELAWPSLKNCYKSTNGKVHLASSDQWEDVYWTS